VAVVSSSASLDARNSWSSRLLSITKR
jgi:hypothetical protein